MGVNSQDILELSKKVSSVEPSATLAISAKAKELQSQGIDVIALSAGEPDFDTPEFIKEAAIKAIREGQTKYTPATGSVALREAISRKFERDQGLRFPASQIIVSDGAKHSIFNALYVLLNDGDEVIIPAPYWLSYTAMVTLLGGKSVVISTTQEESFKLTPEVLRKSLTPSSKVLILNSPSNPTGAVYTKEELAALARVLHDFPKVTVISDEIYEKLVFEGSEHHSIASLDAEIAKRTIVVNGHSKAYAMTGWRLGYAACPNTELAKAIGTLQSHSTSNPTAFAQAGGVAALDHGDADAAKMKAVYQSRRDLFYKGLSAIPKLKPYLPQGAFYMYVGIAETGMNSLSLSEKLLEQAHVAVVPGKPFGNDDYVRMSFATSETKLEEALKRMSAWFSKLS